MAFRQLGVQFVHKGLNSFTSAIDRVNRTLKEYGRTQIENSRKNVAAARSVNQLAQAHKRELTSSINASVNSLNRYSNSMIKSLANMSGYTRASLALIRNDKQIIAQVNRIVGLYKQRDQVEKALLSSNKLTSGQTKNLLKTYGDLESQIASIIDYSARLGASYGNTKEQKVKLYNATKKLIEVMVSEKRSIDDIEAAFDEWKTALTDADNASKNLADSEKNWQNITQQFMDLGKNLTIVKAATGDVISIFNVLGNVFSAFGRIIGAVLGTIGKVAVAIGKTLFNAIKKIISIPINIIKGIFNAFTGGLQRIFEIVVGMNLSRLIWGIGLRIKELAKEIYNAGVEFQFTQIRLEGLIKREYREAGYDLADSLEDVSSRAEELTDWVTKLSILSPVSSESILQMMTLAMSYNFTSREAQTLTEAITKFSTGMGLADDESRRIIENFGQMRQQGKLAGTELRDLARGAFVPVTDVLKRMGINLDVISGVKIPSLGAINADLLELKSTGKITNAEFEKIDAGLRELSVGSSISASALKQLYSEGVISKNVLEKLGTSISDLDIATSDVSFDKMKDELNALLEAGEITVDEFFWAFVDIVNEDFNDALDNASNSMKIVQQNIKDFRETMIGWRIITPILDVISGKMSEVMHSIMNEETIEFFDNFGKSLGIFTELLMNLVDVMFDFSNYKNTLGTVFGYLKTLFSVMATFGSNDEEAFINALHELKNFLYHIPNFSGESSVISGIQLLKKTFEGMGELDSQTIINNLKTSLDLIWTPLKEQIILPQLAILFNDIKTFAVDKWENDIKPAFSDFMTDTVVPGLKTFISETIPEWATILSTNAPIIAGAVGTTLANAFGSLAGIAEESFGENSIWGTVFETLESLTNYLMFKGGVKETPISYDTPSIKTQDPLQASGLADNLKELTSAAGEAKEGVSSFLQDALEPLGVWMEEHDAMLDFFESFVNYFLELSGVKSGVGLFKDIVGLVKELAILFTGDEENGLEKASGFLFRFAEALLDFGTAGAKLATFPVDIFRSIIRGITEFAIIMQSWEYGKELDWSTFDWANVLDPLTSLPESFLNIFSGGDDVELPLPGESGSGKESIFDKLKGWIKGGVEGVEEYAGSEEVTGASSGVINLVNTMMEDISAVGNEGNMPAKLPMEDVIEESKTKWEELNEDLIGKSIIPDMVTDIQKYFDENVPGFIDPFEQFEEDLVEIFDNISSLMNGEEIDVTRRRKGNEPEKQWGEESITQFYEMGLALAQEFERGINDGWYGEDGISTTWGRGYGDLVDCNNEYLNNFYEMALDLANHFRNGIYEGWYGGGNESGESIVDSWSGGYGDLLDTNNEYINNFTEAGASLVQGLWDGMLSKFAELLIWWETIALPKLNEITTTIEKIGSPSKVFMHYGEMIVAGLQIGMEKKFNSLTGEFTRNMSGLSSIAGHVASPGNSTVNNNYSSSLDNRNITINMVNGGNYLSLDYDYVRAIT